MAIEMGSDYAICFKCGMRYSRRKGFFPVSYSVLYKGMGFMPVCRSCIDAMYITYLSQCNDAKTAVRQMCRKFDLFWSEKAFDSVAKKATSRSIMAQYIAKLNSSPYVGKCYDDTLAGEGTLWNFSSQATDDVYGVKADEIDNGADTSDNQTDTSDQDDESKEEVAEDVVEFWGLGYPPSMYRELEQRRQYWMSRFPEGTKFDIGTEALIRQICSLEIDINRDRIAGRPVDKSVSALNTLLGSANLKPSQRKEDADTSLENTPFGVWIRRWETQRPIPEPDPELKDTDGIVRYISIWFLGHLCKMLGIKNTYCKLYEDEIAKLRIDKPEYDDEDDEVVFNDVFEERDAPDDDGDE